MSDELLDIKLPVQRESIIKVIGVGGGGSNAVNYMCMQGIFGVEFVVCNTDIQALRQSPVKNRIQLGASSTEGRGAGCRPEKGREAAVESLDFIRTLLSHKTKMVFITAGMGGGTGTGAAPVIAEMAKELGLLTVGIVTLPFSFEGRKKMEQAMEGIDELEKFVDALLIIQNDKLKQIHGDLKLSEAFAKADDVLAIAAKSIAELITFKGYVNVDFADVEGVMRNSGVALMGAAEGTGENRAMDALHDALVSPLLNSHDIRGASNILINVLYGNHEVTMDEVALITETLQAKVGGNVDIIWGAGEDKNLGDRLRVAIIAVGFNRYMRSSVDDYNQETEKTKEQKTETAFKIEDMPEELEMVALNSAELEEQARRKRMKQEEQRVRKQEQESDDTEERTLEETAVKKKKKGVNDMPDSDGWFKNKFMRGLFDDDSWDTEMK